MSEPSTQSEMSPTTESSGDQAFRATTNRESWPELNYGGALSFLRRRYTRDLTDVDVVVSGIPYDCATTYRSGCRLGARALRSASSFLTELPSFPFGFTLFDHLSVVDYGDCQVDPHHPATVAATIEAHADTLLASGAMMLTLGGDHFVTYPLLRAHAKVHGPISLLQFDAHCDTWPDDGTRLDHGTMFARAVSEGIVDPAHSCQVGLRTYNDTSMGFEILTSPWIHKNGVDAALSVIHERMGDRPVYVSFDVDVLDPAFAPGTGTPVSGGLATWQALELVRGLRPLRLIGMDVVEVSPPYDHGEITALAGATVAHDWLCVVAEQRGAKGTKVGRL